MIEPNGWVYVLYAQPQTLKLSTTLHWRITYIPCYRSFLKQKL
jgi:hypothetical protein